MPKKKTAKKTKRSVKKSASRKTTAKRSASRNKAVKRKSSTKKSVKKPSRKEEVITELNLNVKPNVWLTITLIITGAIIFNLITPLLFNQTTGQGTVSQEVVQVTYLYDEDCAKCYDVSINSLIFEQLGIEVNETYLSIHSTAGSQLLTDYNITKVPTFILSEEALNNEYLAYIWPQIGSVELDGALVFRVPEGFLQAQYNQLGNFYDLSNLTDYVSYKDLTTSVVEVPETFSSCSDNDTVTMMLFVVSECPWCAKLETDVLPNLTLDFGNRLILEPHYLMQESASGSLTSMHGQTEYEENLRGVCADLQGGWLEYTNCINDGSDWGSCVNSTGLNLTEFNECYSNEALTIAEQDADLSLDYNVMGTPTIIFNCNLIYAGNWTDYAVLKEDLCSLYDSLPDTCNN